MGKDEAMEIILANSVRCERMAALISTKACAARAEWDSKCAGCGRNSRALKDYGQHKCVCGRLVKKEDGLCEACYRDAHPYKRASIQNKRPEVKPQVAEESVVAETKSEAVKGCKESRVGDRQSKTCKCCGVRTRIAARGLGVGCYKRERAAGTLDANFPALMPGRAPGVKGKTPGKAEPTAKCEGCGKDIPLGEFIAITSGVLRCPACTKSAMGGSGAAKTEPEAPEVETKAPVGETVVCKGCGRDFEKTAEWQDICPDCVKAKIKEIHDLEAKAPMEERSCANCGQWGGPACNGCGLYNSFALWIPRAQVPKEDLLGDLREGWASLSRDPEKGFLFTGSIVAVLAEDRDLALAHRIEESATEHRRSVNQHVLYLIEQGLKAVGG